MIVYIRILNTYICITLLNIVIMIEASAQKFEIQGHRGARGLMPENTIIAFEKALSLGINTLEMDVCISKDLQVVVSHEPYFHADYCSLPDGSPVTKAMEASLNLYQMDYATIKQYDTGKRGNKRFPAQQPTETHKPLLSEVIAFAEQYTTQNGLPPIKYNIEIKSEEKEYDISQPDVATFSALVYEVIKQLPAERVTLQSFDFNVLRFWKKQIENGQYKRVSLSALVEKMGVSGTLHSLQFNPDVYSPYYKLLTKGKVAKCHKKGIRVIPWTVNDPDAMQHIKDIGCDGLITDYPDRVEILRR
jgi:glycerophosphoryl diester phosphodiesterase